VQLLGPVVMWRLLPLRDDGCTLFESPNRMLLRAGERAWEGARERGRGDG
jgi:hypothetical protein